MVSVVSLSTFLQPFSFNSTLPVEPSHASLESQLKELGLLKSSRRFKDLPFHKLSYYCVPEGTEEQLELVTAVLTFMFLFDDQFDDTEELRSSTPDIVLRMGNVWRTNTLPEEATAIEQLGLWVNNMMINYSKKLPDGHIVYNILLQDLIQYIEQGIEPFLELQSSLEVPTLETYMELRRMNVGAYPLISLINFVRDSCASEEFLRRKEVQRMQEIVVDLVTITNDVFSFSKDKAFGFNKNYFNILLQLHQLNPAIALENATKQTTELIQEFNALKGTVQTANMDSTDKVDELLQRQSKYIDELLPIVAASVQWSLDIERYTSPTSPFAEFRVSRKTVCSSDQTVTVNTESITDTVA